MIKFADDTAVLGLINNNDETAYREGLRALAELYQDNNLSLNVNKSKELDCELQETSERACPHPHCRDSVERVKSFKILGVHITGNLKWSIHNLRRLKKFVLARKDPHKRLQMNH
jgi:hypothetical protein